MKAPRTARRRTAICEASISPRIPASYEAIIGASAIDEDGALLDFDYREVQAAQAIIANARSVMLVADSTKLQRSAPVRIAHLSQIQTFVTDLPLPSGLQNICTARGISVITALPGKAPNGDGSSEAESGS